ncbi:MAG: hypothetical protein BWY78_00439 [Alphaproteobacteria bacterium ADurb.Bin438]|nr:MAG: hypothetical protein BWY78_00439 [Alphaproteobacteria bacterium ADurb.Bin438]
MNNKNFCSCMVLGGTFASALFHFVFCGLPAILGIVGVIFGVYGSLSFDFITSDIRTILLIVSGLFIMISFLFYLKERCCINNPKAFKIKKIILFSSVGFYLIGIIFHILSLNVMVEPACH